MDLNEMKASWKKAGATESKEPKIARFIQHKGHYAVVRKIRIKLFIEAAFMALLLFFFYDIFDGDQKPVYANVALVIGALFYFSTNVLSYFTLRQVTEEPNIRSSVGRLLRKVWQAKILSLSAMVLFMLMFLLFFTSTIDLTPRKYLLIAFFLVFALVQVYLAAKMWNSRIKKLQQVLDELEE